MIRGTLSFAIVCVTLCAGCLPPRLLASRDLPHIVADRTTVIGWCRNKEGKVEKCRVQVIPGDVVAPQELLDRGSTTTPPPGTNP
jgi:hypothetical protein